MLKLLQGNLSTGNSVPVLFTLIDQSVTKKKDSILDERIKTTYKNFVKSLKHT